MGQIRVALRRAWLSWCYDNDTGSNLRAALVAQRDARAAGLKTGSTVSASAANQHSVSFSAPGEIGYSPSDLMEFWQEMIDLYDWASSVLTTPTNAEIYAEMIHTLQPADRVQNDYSGLRA